MHKTKIIKNKLFLRRRFFTIKMQERQDLLTHINMVKVVVNELCSIEMKIQNENMYMVFLMNLPLSFDNLVMSLESMSTKDVDLHSIVA